MAWPDSALESYVRHSYPTFRGRRWRNSSLKPLRAVTIGCKIELIKANLGGGNKGETLPIAQQYKPK